MCKKPFKNIFYEFYTWNNGLFQNKVNFIIILTNYNKIVKIIENDNNLKAQLKNH